MDVVASLSVVQKRVGKKRTRMTQGDLMWLVGFLEGEGCFNRNRTSIRISVAQRTREPLERVKALIGGHIYRKCAWAGHEYGYRYLTRDGRLRRYKTKPGWQWNLYTGAAALCRELLPHMSRRRQKQIRKALTT